MTEMIKPKMMDYKRHVLVCIGSKCTENGDGQILYQALKEKLKEKGLSKGKSRVIKSKVSCLGTCTSGPLICVQPDGVWYFNINSKKLDQIIEDHLIHGKPVTEYIYHQS